jgi:hypothetical protein
MKVPAVIPFGLMSHQMAKNNKEEYKNGGCIFPKGVF